MTYMIKQIITYTLIGLLISCATQQQPVDYVDPFIGTGFHGHTYPGATTPFGAVQLSPDTRSGDWDACAGYHYSDSTIAGFSHTHLSGTGCADLADVLFHPTMTTPDMDGTYYKIEPYSFEHKNERASCGYYSVKLPDDGLNVELTATPHCGVHRYTFSGDGTPRLIVDLRHTVTDERIDMSEIVSSGDNEISGMRRTQGWVENQYVFFTAQFSEPIANIDIIDGRQALVSFNGDVKSVVAKVGLSAVSVDNARENLLAEVSDFDFDAVSNRAKALWIEALSDIVVEGGSTKDSRNFYTAQYHTKVSPNVVSDVNGAYRRHDMTIAQLPDGEKRYSTLSLWDTFRAWHPLQTMVNVELVNQMIRSMLDMYDATGELPIWPLAAGETRTMIGYHAVSVIADAYMKGIRDYDVQKALEAMKHSSNINKKGADYYVKYGFIPSNIKRESVSCLLEYAYDDWTIARMAEAMGRSEDATEYYNRALNYINVFDGSTRFFRGKQLDGSWSTPFDEFRSGRDYTEATPWQYRFFVPHDVNGMVQLFGSREAFVAELDRLFALESASDDLGMVDITGLVGQYAHGNEPSHHMSYLYNYVGQAWKTQQMTRRLLDEMYQPTPEGICGNEDCGQMSAWYILTSLGFYPVSPASNEFVLTTPLFEKATIRLSDAKTFVVKADNPKKNRYIKSVKLNGQLLDRTYITYQEIMDGGELEFSLCKEPDKQWGASAEAAPYSLTRGSVVSLPYTTATTSMFVQSVNVDLATTTSDAQIRYTLDGSEPTENSPVYESPITIDRTVTIKAKGYKKDCQPSRTLVVEATKAQFEKPIIIAEELANGVDYRYYEGRSSNTDMITTGRLVDSGRVPEPSIANARQEDYFGYVFTGVIYIPKRGIWQFMTASDDGSVLYIADKKVVDNDGSHAAVVATGKIALEQGYYQYKLLYFEDYEGHELRWGWASPESDTFESIPAENLFVK